jgi:hypothetical protein
MASDSKVRDPIRAALARLGNPYAFDEMQYPDTAQQEFFLQRRAHLRALEDPYASLSVADAPIAEPKLPQPIERPAARRTCSKVEFQARCRAIFAGYMPAPEKGRLRDHYRDFILRNESRNPEMRYRLLTQLSKYDLSTSVGLTGRFNRERDVLTEQKLRSIERDAEECE